MSDTTLPSAPITSQRAKTKQAVMGMAVAAAILVAAWFVAGQAGLSDIGQGGINASILPKVGDEAPNFIAISPTGDVVQLSDFRGQPVWINFWGAWCAPCRAEMPDIQSAWEVLEPRGLMLLAVSLGDKPSEALAFAELNDVTFPILLDPDRTLTSPTYPIYNFPTHIFVDEDGIVRNIVMAQMNQEEAIAAAEPVLTKERVTSTRLQD